MAKSRLANEFEGYPADNVIQCTPGERTKMLADILESINTNPANQLQVHWAACRAIDLLIV
jgi:hypothetical protein